MSLKSSWRWLFVPKWPDWVDQRKQKYQAIMQPRWNMWMSLKSSWRWLFVPKWPDLVDQRKQKYQAIMQPNTMVNRFLTFVPFNLGNFYLVVSEIVAHGFRFIIVDVLIQMHKEKHIMTPSFAIYGTCVDFTLMLSGHSLEMVGFARTIIAI